MQKVFVLEETEERKTLEGRRFGVTNCLAKSSNYNSLHEMIIPEKHIPKIQSNLNKFVLLKGYSQKEDGSIRLAESSTVSIVSCFKHYIILFIIFWLILSILKLI